jgi:predicted enzyme related to lactoylglutathione lyase
MTVSNAFAGVAVKDLNVACRWYERVLERPADTRPMTEVAEWHFPKGGWLQVFQDASRAGASSVTLAVSDIDEELRKLNAQGLEVGGTTDTDTVKTAIVTDPDGNQIVFAQARTAGIAS